MDKLINNPAVTYAGIGLSVLGVLIWLFETGFHNTRSKILFCIVMAGCAALSWFVPPAGCAAALIIPLWTFISYRMNMNKLSFRPEDWTPWQQFEAEYREGEDESGNYVIIVSRGEAAQYERAFVGGSPTVHREVHLVLNDRMLSKVYDDIQEGMNCWVRIIPASADTMDGDRQKLIELYHGIPYLLSFEEVRRKREKVH